MPRRKNNPNKYGTQPAKLDKRLRQRERELSALVPDLPPAEDYYLPLDVQPELTEWVDLDARVRELGRRKSEALLDAILAKRDAVERLQRELPMDAPDWQQRRNLLDVPWRAWHSMWCMLSHATVFVGTDITKGVRIEVERMIAEAQLQAFREAGRR